VELWHIDLDQREGAIWACFVVVGGPEEEIPMPYHTIAATTILGMARVTQ
jgi:hypothetical protein